MILVTGATGNVGGLLCDALQNRKVAKQGFVRAMSRPIHASDRRFDFLDAGTFAPALDGIKQVFLVRPPALAKPNKDMAPFLRACKTAGVEQIVFLSLQGADKNTWTPHAKIEQLIRDLSLDYTYLRPSFFMQNLTMQHAREIRERSEIFAPAGHGKTNFIDARDIADVAALVLTTPNHLGQAYELTGSQGFSYSEVAQMLSAQLNRQVVYAKPGLLRYIARQLSQGTPLGFALVTSVIYSIARLGKANHYSPELETLLARPPRTLAAFIKEHSAVWTTIKASPQ
ncbi:SDR family oxidoreductase [Salinibius halmophilus]|uniref:SDR family oxidoreductase n=1 Tax=Salinibius halmophilus TaxID=1853216 RepID=UPI000E66EC34|nr:SDR family oxidoreductase [Salinibius halmophilus]